MKAPSSVAVYDTSYGTLRSVKLTPKDERQFAFTDQNGKICFAKDCLSLRASFANSGKINDFDCKHLKEDVKNPLYAVSFTSIEIDEFTPDRAMREYMKETQSEDLPSVVKVSKKNYAVIGPISTSNTMRYAHVMECPTGQGTKLKCFFNECRKKYGRTKQVSGIRI